MKFLSYTFESTESCWGFCLFVYLSSSYFFKLIFTEYTAVDRLSRVSNWLLIKSRHPTPPPPPPQDPINELIIQVESVVSCRFQIHLCILACVMSREFTREAVTKFLPAQFPWIWCECLLRNIIHSKIFNLTKCREVLVKCSLLITHAGMPIWIWHYIREPLTDSFFK